MVSWQLVLHPVDAQWCPPSLAELTSVFTELGVFGPGLAPTQSRCWSVGPTFLQYVSFMGCAPALSFDPQQSQTFIHWQVSPCFAEPKVIVDAQQAAPRCGYCRARLDDWRGQCPDLQQLTMATSLYCSHCQRSQALTQADWRRHAGWARWFVSLVNIYPQEALPTDALLSELARRSKTDWRYFYCQRAAIE